MTVFEPGETITVEWDEYFNHPSYYRISFDADGDDDFSIREDMDTLTQNSDDPETVQPVDEVILAYVFEEPDMGSYSAVVTLPNVECENCTLQLVQFMYDKVGNGQNDEYYFQCADIALRGSDGGTGGADGAGAGGASATGGDTGAGGDATGGVDGGGGGIGTGGAPETGSGGASASGGALSAGGALSTGGTLSTGGATASGGDGQDDDAADTSGSDDTGGGCSISPRSSKNGTLSALLALALLGLLRRSGGHVRLGRQASHRQA